MSTIDSFITALLVLLPASAAVRAIICLIKMQMDSEQASVYKRRLINLLIFTVIAECVMGLLSIVSRYIIDHSASGTF